MNYNKSRLLSGIGVSPLLHPAALGEACLAPGEEIVPSKEPAVKLVAKSNERVTVKCPVAPANRPVPPEMNAVSTMDKTPGVVGLACEVKSAVSMSPLAAVNAKDPSPVRVKRFAVSM